METMEFMTTAIDTILHLDVHLTAFVDSFGILSYVILFLIVFAETGLVILPFLPGDSLLFAAGSLCALGSLHFSWVFAILACAAIFGDAVNYWIGHYFGRKIIDNPKITFINQEHIDKTEQFYKRYGGKTIILARFIPVVRTFAPIVAGIGTMSYRTFLTYNIVGGFIWTWVILWLGYGFGEIIPDPDRFIIPAVLILVVLSSLPALRELFKYQRNSKQK